MTRRGRGLLLVAAVPMIGLIAGVTLPPGQSTPPAGTLLLTVAQDGAASGTPEGGPRTTLVRSGGARRPLFLVPDFVSADSPSPDFEGTRLLFVGRRRDADPPAIWETTIDGTRARMITAGHGAPGGPAFLPGGRIVFSDVPSDPVEAAGGVRALFSCAPDGSDICRLTFAPRRDEYPEVLADGRLRYRSRGLTDDGAAGGTLMTIHPDGTQVAAFPVGLSVQEPVIAAGARPPGAEMGEMTLPGVGAPEGYAVLTTTPLAAHATPRILTSLVDPTRPTGTLLCLDVYTSRIPSVAGLPRGVVRGVRLRRLSAGSAPEDTGLLGEVPVEADGSFFVSVPADVPLGLSLVSRDGQNLGTLRSGIWVRPNENRGCVGCHEEPDRAPENRRPLAVLREPSTLRPNDTSTEGVHEAH
jgi:hydrazine synthase alpha subunit-like protein